MQIYIGTKLIKAESMGFIEYSALREWVKPLSEQEGYLVEYSEGGEPNVEGFDGYVSWSPKAVFEKAYFLTEGVNFGMALEAAKIGMGFRLPAWSDDVVIKAQFPEDNSKMTAPYLYVQSHNGRVPWKETMIELFSTEWEIVRPI